LRWATKLALSLGLTLLTPAATLAAVTFVDATVTAKIRFVHENGATGAKYLPETMGSGVAFFDFDNDGWPDLYFVNSKSWKKGGKASPSALYRNQRDGTFRDVTAAAGVGFDGYGIGVTAADYDNDGWADLYVTGLEGNRLYRNRGDGRFTDVTAAAGVQGRGFATSALFFDYDADGWLDLFVANYVEWSIADDIFCTLDGETKSYCTPESYRGQSPILYRNKGDGTFEDVTRKAGLSDASSKSLGVVMLDYDADDRLDLFVANDTQPNKLYRNLGNGRFEEDALASGIAFGETGVARAGMGVDAVDYSGTGRPSVVIGNFSNEMLGLYHNEGNGLFLDEAAVAGLGRSSLLTLAFGVFFFDYDLDGEFDVFTANGHVADDINVVQPSVTHAQSPHLFRGLGKRRFVDVAKDSGTEFVQPLVARGAAYADYDNDGDLDVVVTQNGGRAKLFRNDGGNAAGFVRIRLVGKKSNHEGIGAKVTLSTPDGQRRWRRVHTGSSYASQSALDLTFGVGAQRGATSIEVAWPSGQLDRVGAVPAGSIVTVTEGEGATTTSPLPSQGAALAQ
jgi:hypothetical protein